MACVKPEANLVTIGIDRVAQQSYEWLAPGKRVVRAHRSAHHADTGESARILGNRFLAIERDQLPANPVLPEPVGEVPGSRGGRKAPASRRKIQPGATRARSELT